MNMKMQIPGTLSAPLDVSGLAFSDDATALLVTTEERRDSLARPKQLSFSAADSYDGCPAGWVGSQSFRVESIDPMQANSFGSAIHGSWEYTGKLEASQRTRARADRELDRWLLDELIQKFKKGEPTPYSYFAPDSVNEFLAEAKRHLDNAFRTEDPSKIDVVAAEYQIKQAPIGGFGNVRLGGYIDVIQRPLEYINTNAGVEVLDLKTGKKSEPFGNQLDKKEMQALLYTASLRTNTEFMERYGDVVFASILYSGIDDPKKAKVSYDTSPEKVQVAVNWFTDQYDGIVTDQARGEFKLNPSPLCGWCVLANVCPVAKIGSDQARAKIAAHDAGVKMLSEERINEARAKVERAKQAAATQWSKEELPIPMLSRGAKVPAAPRILQFDQLSVSTKDTLAMTNLNSAADQGPAAVLDTSLAPSAAPFTSTGPAHPVAPAIPGQAPAAAPAQAAPAAPAIPGSAPAAQEAPAVQAEQPTVQAEQPAAPTQASAFTQVEPRPEAVPYEELVTLRDGSKALNLNSYSAGSMAGTVSLALELLHKHGHPTPAPSQINSLARVIHSVRMNATSVVSADPSVSVPEGSTPMSAVTTQLGAATRVTGILRTVIELYGIPIGAADSGVWSKWIADTTRRVIGLMKMAIALHDDGLDQLDEGVLNGLLSLAPQPTGQQ